jgi:3-oxoacyl-[acyl-carrier-protein] synthase II
MPDPMEDPQSAAHASDRIIIAGCGVVSAVGAGVDSLRSAMVANRSGLRRSERFNGPRFQSQVVGEAPRNGNAESSDDPAYALASVALREAVAQANPILQKLEGKRVGLVLSTTKANIEALERISSGRPCSATARRHLEGDLLAADLAAEYRAQGPVQCISLACVSGLVALQQGARMIQRDKADAVMVVGVDHLSAFVVAGFSALKALDPEGCRPFDRDRCGLSPGEAGAAIVLARASTAPSDAITIRGWGSTNDANHMTGPSRDGSGLAAAIRCTLDMAHLEPEQISYINAHGTGTPYNDAMESMALQTVFGSDSPPVSGSKGMLGHTLGAAGVVETILCILAMQQGMLPGTPRLGTPAEGTPGRLLREPIPGKQLDYVLKLNTGFGGVNGALVLGRNSASERVEP